MTKHVPSFRGVAAVRAQAGDAAALAEELATAFGDFRKRNDGRLETIEAAVDTLLANNAAAQVGPAGGSAPTDRAGRKAFAHFLKRGPEGMPQAAMRESGDADGGYAVPETIDRTIQHQLVDFSPLRDWATVVTLGAGVGKYSFIVNRRGASSGWVNEEQARPETDTPQLGLVTPPEGEIYANAAITQWLLDDAGFDMDAFIRENITDEFAVQEGVAFVNGDGNNMPSGYMMRNKVSTGDDTRPFGELQYIPSGVAAALTDSTHNGSDVLIDLTLSLKAAYRAGPGVGWMMNSTTAGVIRKLKDGDDRYIWQQNLTDGQPSMLLGYPVAIDENLSNIGANAYPIVFGNWRRGYRIVDRLGTRVLRDPYTKKPYVLFYVTKRVGGSVADSKAIKLLKIATS